MNVIRNDARTIQNVDNKTVSRLCTLNSNWTGQIVDFGKVDVLDVVAVVVVADLSARSVDAFNTEDLARFDGYEWWDVGAD